MPMEQDTAGVIAPPPVLYASALAAALALDRIAPRRLVSRKTPAIRRIGGALIATGLSASIAVTLAFRKAATAISPTRPTTRLVRAGPYRYSRNPDYIGQFAVYVGIALMANTWWPIRLLPLVLSAVDRCVIRREERYLESKFGSAYRAYQRSVPRWL